MLLSPVYQSFVITFLFLFLFLFSYFPYFKFVTFKTRVIFCNTLKKEGRAFRNIGKYIPILFNQPCLFSSLCLCQPNIWSMAAVLRDSVAAVVVVRTRPRAMPLATIAIRKSTHGFLFLFYKSMGLRLEVLWAAGAPLLINEIWTIVKGVRFTKNKMFTNKAQKCW